MRILELNLCQLPPAPTEYGQRDQGQRRIGDQDGIAYPADMQVHHLGEKKGQGDLHEPEGNEVDPDGRGRIARTVYGIDHHLAQGIYEKAE